MEGPDLGGPPCGGGVASIHSSLPEKMENLSVGGSSSQRPHVMSTAQVCSLGCKLSAGVVYPLICCRRHSIVSWLINNK